MTSPETPRHRPDLSKLPLLVGNETSPTAAALVGANGHRPAATATLEAPQLPTKPVHVSHRTDVDWALVGDLARDVAKRLVDVNIKTTTGRFNDNDREQGRSIIRDVIRQRARTNLDTGHGPVIDADQEHTLNRAVFDKVFQLGRWQPLLDEDGITDIEITGHDQVFVVTPDGQRHARPPVADSDEELERDIAHLAEVRGRKFSSTGSNWELQLYLEDQKCRLMALSTRVAHRPIVRLRLDPAGRPTLDTLVTKFGMLDDNLASFLRAAIRAGLSIAVSGPMGGGKTTTARAMAMEIPPWESVATIETERELFLHDCRPEGAAPVIALEGHPGGNEPDALRFGRRAGQIDLSDMIPPLLRGNLDRILAGECRGAELMAMFQAMQQGAGGLTTLHAKSSTDAISRMVLMAEMSQVVNAEQAERLVGQHIQLIVHVAKIRDYKTGQITRGVKEVLQVKPGPDSFTRIATQRLFWPTPDSVRPVPAFRPDEDLMMELAHAGYPATRFNSHRSAEQS